MANLRTYSDLVTDIQDKFGETTAVFGDETNNSIRKWIIQKEYDIYSTRKWPFMRSSGTITTTASDGTYSLGTDYAYGSIYDVIDTTNKTRLYRATAKDIDTYYAGSTSEGNPTYYFLDGTGTQTTALTGSINTTASTTVTGVSTLFTTELVVGDKILVGTETRTVATISSATSLTVDTAFTDQADDTAIEKITNNVQQITFFPIPSGAFTLTYRYYKDPTPIDITTAATNDIYEPILPRRYRAMLVDAVLEELLQKDTNALADRVNAKYEAMLRKMILDYSDDFDNTPRRKSADELGSQFGTARLPSNYPSI